MSVLKKAVKKATKKAVKTIKKAAVKGAKAVKRAGLPRLPVRTTRKAKKAFGRAAARRSLKGRIPPLVGAAAKRAGKKLGGTAASSVSRPPIRRGQTADAILAERRRQARKHRR